MDQRETTFDDVFTFSKQAVHEEYKDGIGGIQEE